MGLGDHLRDPALVRRCAGYAPSGHTAITLRGAFNPPTPLARILTFPHLPDITRRGCAEQQRVRCRAFDRRDPSIIIPNHPPHAEEHAMCPISP